MLLVVIEIKSVNWIKAMEKAFFYTRRLNQSS